MQKKRVPYLREYAPPNISLLENLIVKSPGSNSIYLVKNLSRHVFPNMKTFVGMNHEMEKIKVLPVAIVDYIPVGIPVKSIY
jgi:hypothetical protein